MPSSDLLAVAFTDLNGNNKYNPGKDTLIAALWDTNNDGVVSVGDTIQWGTYPAIPDGSASGTGGIYTQILFTTVTAVNPVFDPNLLVSVQTTAGTVIWAANPNAEAFSTNGPFGLESSLVDSINLLLEDRILTTTTAPGPGLPNTNLDVHTLQSGDQAFLDVWIA